MFTNKGKHTINSLLLTSKQCPATLWEAGLEYMQQLLWTTDVTVILSYPFGQFESAALDMTSPPKIFSHLQPTGEGRVLQRQHWCCGNSA